MNDRPDLRQQLDHAREALTKDFLSGIAAECEQAQETLLAAFVEAHNSDGSAESMLRVAQAADAAAKLLGAIAQDTAVQATVIHGVTLRSAAAAVGTTPNTVTRWAAKDSAARPTVSPVAWWVNESELVADAAREIERQRASITDNKDDAGDAGERFEPVVNHVSANPVAGL